MNWYLYLPKLYPNNNNKINNKIMNQPPVDLTNEAIIPYGIYGIFFHKRYQFIEINLRNIGNENMRKCSYCREYGHSINLCCSERALTCLRNITTSTNRTLSSYRNRSITEQQFRNEIRVYFDRFPYKTLFLFSGFIDIVLRGTGQENKISAIVNRLEEISRPPSRIRPPRTPATTQVEPMQQVLPVPVPAHVPLQLALPLAAQAWWW